MREVAEKLIEAMALALEGKKAGAAGNFEGVINQTMRTLETVVQAASGTDAHLRGLVARAKKIQLDAARTVSGASKRGGTGADAGARVSLAGAFEFQKKRSLNTPPPAAVGNEDTVAPDLEEPGDTLPAPEGSEGTNLVRQLAGMKVQELIANFGGMEGLRVFSMEMFNAAQRAEEPDARFVGRVRGLLKQMAKDV